jgi:PIN domain nuclease of toxin-antitoxin system
MQLLIDTQAILWFQSSDIKLSNKVRDLIIDKGNACFISIASLWEIAIKINLNKLTIGIPFENFPEYLINSGFEILDLKFSHLKALSGLNNHHKDPFDRLLISQALSEDMTIITADQHFLAYPPRVIW